MTACETGYFQQAALQKINAEGEKRVATRVPWGWHGRCLESK